jgi:hypothetical protein
MIVTMSVPHHSLLKPYLVPHSLTSHSCNNILRSYYGITATKYCEQATKQERRQASKQQYRYLNLRDRQLERPIVP